LLTINHRSGRQYNTCTLVYECSGLKLYYHTRALRHIRPLLTCDATNLVRHSIVSSRLDYANALLYGRPAANIHRLQGVHNSLTRVICQAPRSASATKLRQQLQWLPVYQRINFKLAVDTYKTTTTTTPAYLSHLIYDYNPGTLSEIC